MSVPKPLLKPEDSKEKSEGGSIKDKTPELASKMYKNCIEKIKRFQIIQLQYEKYIKEFHKKEEGKERLEEKLLKIACLKADLMQSICLIGDSFTWLRAGRWGRDQYQHSTSKLYVLATAFDNSYIQHIIELRNIYPHKFLYMNEAEKVSEFDKLLQVYTKKALATIRETMESQLSSLGELQFTGKTRTPNVEPCDIESCWAIALDEIALMESIISGSGELKKMVEQQTIDFALNWSIKNICQVYQDYRRQSELIDKPGATYSKQQIEAIDDELIKLNKSDKKQIKEAIAFLDNHAVDLRIYLAHPNIQSDESLREKFLTHLNFIKQGLNILWENCFRNQKKTGIILREHKPSQFYLKIPEKHKKHKKQEKVTLPSVASLFGDSEGSVSTSISSSISSKLETGKKRKKTKKNKKKENPQKSEGFQENIGNLVSKGYGTDSEDESDKDSEEESTLDSTTDSGSLSSLLGSTLSALTSSLASQPSSSSLSSTSLTLVFSDTSSTLSDSAGLTLTEQPDSTKKNNEL